MKGQRQVLTSRLPLFERRLGELQKQHGLTDKALAAKLKVDQSAPHHWRSGRARPNLSRFLEMAAIFGVSPNDLLGWVPPSHPDASRVFRLRGEQIEAQRAKYAARKASA